MTQPDEEVFIQLNSVIERGDEKAVIRLLNENEVKPQEYYEKVKSCLNISRKCVTLAAKHGQVDIVNGLIDLGFDPNENGHHGFRPIRPIHVACEFGHLAVVKTLIENYGVKAEAEFGEDSPLYLAVLNNMVDVYKYLIEDQKVSVNVKCGMQRNSLLHIAVKNEDQELCEYLVAHGADVNVPNFQKVTPLTLAASKNLMDMVRVLADAGANLDVKNTKGDTLLMSAVLHDDYDLVKYLGSKGADPEIPDKDGSTPLNIAVYNNRYNITRYLICDLNVSFDTPNKRGLTPFDCAVQSELFPIMHLFLNAGYMSKLAVSLKVQDFSMIAEWLNHFGKFQEVVFTPRKLTELACFKIRHVLGRNLPKVVSELPLPENLLKMVMLEYIPMISGRSAPIPT